MLYEFACPDDLLEVAGACGVKDIWVTPCYQLSADQDRPLRQFYHAEIVVTTRLPQGVALYRKEIAGDYQVKATAMDIAIELSKRKNLLAYLGNGSRNPTFVFHNGLWAVPADVEPIKVPPRIPDKKLSSRETEKKGVTN